jgi:hypothetical protein
MGTEILRSASPEKVLSQNSDQPNLPEVAGTSFPQLTAILAGFATTIAVQLIIRPEDSAAIPQITQFAILVMLGATLLFISSVIFAINAQAHNYLPFLELGTTGRELFGISDFDGWIERVVRRWKSFHRASIITFYGGIALLLGGVNLIVWEFIGLALALAFLILVTLSVVLTTVITMRSYREVADDNVAERV